MVSQMEDFTSSRAFRVAGPEAFRMAGIAHKDVDHLMVYDAFAHLRLYGLEDLGFVERGEAARFIWHRNSAPGGRLPLNTNGGGLSYTHTGMYGMFTRRLASPAATTGSATTPRRSRRCSWTCSWTRTARRRGRSSSTSTPPTSRCTGTK